jgi:polygalacturonase
VNRILFEQILFMTCQHDPTATIHEATAILQSAIDSVAASGGGIVRVGPGTWTITTLMLRSGVRLHLEFGAVLEAAHDLSLYPEFKPEVNNKDQEPLHLIYALDCEDVALTGPGEIDGQDMAFWRPCRTEEERPYGIFRFVVPGSRPLPLIQFVRCRRVQVADISIRRSPGWTLHCYDCDDVQIRRVRMQNHLLGPNTDGIGITDSRDVIITGCNITTGDDGIVIKSTQHDKACERVIVSDCLVETNCAAFGLGAEVVGAIRDITFTNCIARASLRMIQIQLWHPGTVENVIFSNIVGRTFPSEGVFCERAISVDIQQFHRPEPTLGLVRNVNFSNILCTTRGRILLTAQDGSRICNVTLRDVHLEIPEIEDPAVVVPASRSLQMSNYNPHTRAARAAAVFDNVEGLRIENLSVGWPESPAIPMHGLCLRNTEPDALNTTNLSSSLPGVEAVLRI